MEGRVRTEWLTVQTEYDHLSSDFSLGFECNLKHEHRSLLCLAVMFFFFLSDQHREITAIFQTSRSCDLICSIVCYKSSLSSVIQFLTDLKCEE